MADGRIERANFSRFLTPLRDEIEWRYRQPGIRIKRQIDVRPSRTGGWYASLIYWPEAGLRVQAWYDRFITSVPGRSLWVGLRGSRDRMVAYFDSLSVDIEAKKVIDDSSVNDEGKYSYYEGKAERGRFEKLYSEVYEGADTFAGRYFFGIHRLRQQALPGQTVNFLALLLAGLSISDDDPNSYRKIKRPEGRRRVVQHLKRERDGAAPKEAKKRDGYRCRVCDMHFVERYGARYGRKFAEAHHVVPLAKKRGEYQVSEADFITVCSNCHRMLHRMHGRRGDWMELKKLYRKEA